MNKRLLVAIGLIAVTLIIFLGLNIKKIRFPFAVNKGKSVSSLKSLAEAEELGGRLLQARSIYQKLISDYPDSRSLIDWQKKAEGLNIRLLFSSTVTPKSILYEIKPGDTLEKIAKEFKTTAELIMKSNNLAGEKIIPGRRLKVWSGAFNILVDKSQNTLLLKSDEEIIKAYIVSTGLNNSTPVGNFKIVNKLTNPTWFKAGAIVPPASPENILGTRWLGIDVPGYGIHGTTDPLSLGKQATQGCVRMSNTEVEELYAIVPLGTEVTIID